MVLTEDAYADGQQLLEAGPGPLALPGDPVPARVRSPCPATPYRAARLSRAIRVSGWSTPSAAASPASAWAHTATASRTRPADR
ncbi:hypothetical protein ABZY16_11625 [Streptomyces sp. NPDC006553]|uniref:hypothetical protein n=1 Tax=Streptomyces sp. NPDC006553 TaxID=3157180 RepID=UPI00339E8240